MGWKSLQIWPIYQFSFRILPFPLLHLDHYYEEMCFFLISLESGFLFAAYLTVADLARRGILVYCLVTGRSQYLVRLFSLYWITVGHTIHPPIEGLLPPTGIEPTLFQNLAWIVAVLRVHATAPSIRCSLIYVEFISKLWTLESVMVF